MAASDVLKYFSNENIQQRRRRDWLRCDDPNADLGSLVYELHRHEKLLSSEEVQSILQRLLDKIRQDPEYLDKNWDATGRHDARVAEINACNILFGSGEVLSPVYIWSQSNNSPEALQYPGAYSLSRQLADFFQRRDVLANQKDKKFLAKSWIFTAPLLESKNRDIGINPELQKSDRIERLSVLNNVDTGIFLRIASMLSMVGEENPDALEESLYWSVELGQEQSYYIKVLQALESSGVLYSQEFRALRDKAVDLLLELQSFDKLRETYEYTVFNHTALWAEGEVRQQQKESAHSSQHKDVLPIEETSTQLHLRSVTEWNAAIREIQTTEKNIRESTLAHQVRTSLIDSMGISSPKRERTENLSTKIKKKQEQKASWHQHWIKARQQLRQRYTKTVQRELGLLSNLETGTNALCFESSVDLLVQYLSDSVLSTTLSQKTKKFAQSQQSTEQNSEYFLHYDRLQQSQLLAWMQGLQSVEARRSLLSLVRLQPREAVLAFRLMAEHVCKDTLQTSEEDFLFTPVLDSDSEQIEKVTSFFRELCAIWGSEVTERIPDHRVQSVRKLMDEKFHEQYIDLQMRRIFKWRSFPVIKDVRISFENAQAGLYRSTAAVAFILAGIGVVGGIEAFVGSQKAEAVQPEEYVPDSPDSLSLESLENRTPQLYAQLLNPPYSPTALRMIVPLASRNALFSQGNMGKIEAHYGVIPQDLSLQEGEYAYRIESPYSTVMAPVGWEITRVYIGGAEAGELQRVLLNGISWQEEGGVPDEIVIVIAPAQRDRMLEEQYPGIQAYYPENWYQNPGNLEEGYPYSTGSEKRLRLSGDPTLKEQALAYNTQLSGSPELQQLHLEFIRELEVYSQSGNGDTQHLTKIILEHSSRYYQYIQSHRYYSLQLKLDQTGPDALLAMASNPDSGFYCSVASAAFQAYLTSVGLGDRVFQYVGSTVNQADDELWKDVGHDWNILALPNGQMVAIDTTPPVTTQTPARDLELLQPRFTKNEGIGVPSILGGMSIAGIGIYGLLQEKKRRKLQKKHKEFTALIDSDFRFSRAERNILEAITFALGTTTNTQPEAFIRRIRALLQPLSVVDTKKYGGVLDWVAKNVVFDQAPRSTEEMLDSLPAYEKQIQAQIMKEWLRGTDGVREIFEDAAAEVDAWISESRVPRDSGKQVEVSAPSDALSAAMHYAALVSLVRDQQLILAVKRSLSSEHSSSVSKEIEREANAQKLEVLEMLVRKLMPDLDLHSRNAAYFAVLHKLFE